MSIPVELKYRRWWRWHTKRRDLPASLEEVPAARRLPLWRALTTARGEAGRVFALRYLLDVKPRVFRRLSADQVAALLEQLPWLQVKPDAAAPFPFFEYKGIHYYLPSDHGLNLVVLEYPIADKAFQDYVQHGKPEALHLLCATLCREAEPDDTQATLRGDPRVPLLSMSQAKKRAERLAGLDESVMAAVLYYFAGVKEFVNKNYGPVLFEAPKEGEDEEQSPSAPSLGWWGIFFTVATDGPFGDVDRVHQTRFHTICMYLVERIRQQKAAEMKARLQSPDFGDQK